ncbi:hypothetical protein HPB52_014208 [Rhipicephalus sanguineus]|uniref:Endonuclease/exonuclease/phosphatase domain-containing protein n=1 Tax=Rhipicephalus sanguineus TaxID=34632 RepID=A0A9D4PG57_RHISA|nr:hypothetical protein HPB52_014208 [Rhipicephalus sanguineus]
MNVTPTFPSRVSSPTTKQLTMLCPIPSRPSSPGGRSSSIELIYPTLKSTTSFSRCYLNAVNTLSSQPKATKSPLLILGDFNVKHPEWRYPKADGPGRTLWELAQDLNLSLPTDLRQPSRIGKSVCRDTTPDLSFCRGVRDARSSNTPQSLGSDHYVLAIQVRTSPCKPSPHPTRHTDWDAFQERRLHSAASNIDDLSTWTDQLLADLEAVTASIRTTEDHPAIDSRLAHLWAARTGLTNRWRKQRHNRRLRHRLGCKHTWHLFRHLLDPASAKSVARQQLERVIRAYPGDTTSLMADLAAKYFQLLPPGTPSHPLASYTGAPNPELDADITEAEGYAALLKLHTTSASGPDRIRNVDAPSLDLIPGVKHTLYADDVALWVTSGSDGHIEQTLQRATNVVTSHVYAAGLTCSAARSALFLV